MRNNKTLIYERGSFLTPVERSWRRCRFREHRLRFLAELIPIQTTSAQPDLYRASRGAGVGRARPPWWPEGAREVGVCEWAAFSNSESTEATIASLDDRPFSPYSNIIV